MGKSTGPIARRANGEGSLTYDEKRDRWRGAVSWLEPDGTLKRRAFAGKSKTAVRRKVTALQAEVAAGRRPASPQSLADYLTTWLVAERARVKASTWRYREGHFRLYVIPALGHMKLMDLQPRDVEQLTADLVKRGLSPRTAVGVRVSLRKALRDAERDGLVSRNVAALANAPRVPDREVEYLTKDELRRLLDACDDGGLGPLVIVAAMTGLRQGELLGLFWSDLGTDTATLKPTLTVRRALTRSWDESGWELAEPKTKRSRRTVHLPEQATNALNAQRKQQDADREAAGPDVWQDMNDLIFTDTLGRPFRSWDVNHRFHELLDRSGIRSVPFHALRHSWATLALANGVPLKVVADNLGHASIMVTATFYSGIVPEMGRDAADAVGRALSDV